MLRICCNQPPRRTGGQSGGITPLTLSPNGTANVNIIFVKTKKWAKSIEKTETVYFH
jgi:hypothetical protein